MEQLDCLYHYVTKSTHQLSSAASHMHTEFTEFSYWATS